jgi:hypothetical protein
MMRKNVASTALLFLVVLSFRCDSMGMMQGLQYSIPTRSSSFLAYMAWFRAILSSYCCTYAWVVAKLTKIAHSEKEWSSPAWTCQFLQHRTQLWLGRETCKLFHHSWFLGHQISFIIGLIFGYLITFRWFTGISVTSQNIGQLRGSLEGFCAQHLKLRDFFALSSLKPKSDRISLRGGMVNSRSAKEFDMTSFDLLLWEGDETN